MTPGPSVITIAQTVSTNDAVRARRAAGDAAPIWLRAQRQTAGRGRRGRSWVSLDGNLFLSGLVKVERSLEAASAAAFLAGLAVADVMSAHAPPGAVTLKWPNDVLLDGAKLAGVLLEAETDPVGDGVWLTIGVGVNVAAAPDLEMSSAGARAAATCLAAVPWARELMDLDPLAHAVAAAFHRRLAHWLAAGFAPVRADWLSLAHGLGAMMEAGGVRGVFTDIDADGAMVLCDDDGSRLRVTAGAVRMVTSLDGCASADFGA